MIAGFDIADVFTAGGLAALGQVILIDLTLASDNVLVLGTLASGLPADQRTRVLAIGAGVARNHPAVLLFGLALSVTMMAIAANFMAKVIERYRWITYIGVLVLLYVAGSMMYHGLTDPSVGVIPAVKNAT